MAHVTQHLQVWITVGTAKVVSLTLDDYHCLAGIFALLCFAVGAHVQACFAREAELAEMVLAADTEEQVEAIEWSFPRP